MPLPPAQPSHQVRRTEVRTWSAALGINLPSMARRHAVETARAWGVQDQDGIDALCIVVSELVNNALEHTDTDLIVLALKLQADGWVRVEVADQGRSTRTIARLPSNGNDFLAESGRGLLLVSACSRECGVDVGPIGVGHRVWACPEGAHL